MLLHLPKIILFVIVSQTSLGLCEDLENENEKWPTVGISILVRNKAHALPYFFTTLYNLDYPKDRLYVWIHSDFNDDHSQAIIKKWVEKYKVEYNNIYVNVNSTSIDTDVHMDTSWSQDHFNHVIELREMALNFGRKMWTDYVFMLDADVYLTNNLTLKELISKELPVVAPMLFSDGLYSNFWCGMTDDYYYKRTEDYKPIYERTKVGCFKVPMVHTAVLISLHSQSSDLLTYDPKKLEAYDGPQDDIIAFAVNARNLEIPLTICNDHFYGFLQIPLEDDQTYKEDVNQLLNVKLEALKRSIILPLDPFLEKYVYYPKPWKYWCDQIYMINLERRPERRILMEQSFKELGMDYTQFNAVDGSNIDLNNLRQYSITLMPNYEDPYFERPMRAGEVGCFLSHYYIWKEIADKNYGVTLVLEDDIHFVQNFKQRFQRLMEEIKDLEWDLVYIGRKILQNSEEEYVTAHTTRPLYSYWTLGYLITDIGARKLINAEPLSKMLPVDEFLPIMFDQHPNSTWKSYFPNRNLIALSSAPLLIYPTRYTGQEGYISDTENSELLDNSLPFKNEL